jgi:tetratricopeptide (TPR) repeat protein
MPRKLLTLALVMLIAVCGRAQQNVLVDSLKKRLALAKTAEDRVSVMGKLSLILISTNMAESDRYGQLMNEEAERSRSRKLMIKALSTNGQRYSYVGVSKGLVQKSIGYYTQALKLARENKLDEETAETLLNLSSIYQQVPDLEHSLTYVTEASSIASTLKNDSLQVSVYNSFGNIYQLKKERLLSLRNYLNGLRVAEELKNHDLLRSCYRNLMSFYADIKEYDKSIDFAQKALDQLAMIHKGNEMYNKVVDLFYIGNLYVYKKDFDMSVSYFEQSIRLADSLKYQPLKMPAYQGLLAQYMDAHEPQKALAFLNNRPDLKEYITNFGYGQGIDRFYAVIYRDLGRYDSAAFYFNRAAPAYEATGTSSNKMEFYYQYADFFKRSGQNTQAIAYYQKAKGLADTIGDLDWQEYIAKELDTVYKNISDYKQSYYYNSLYHQYKDSLRQLGEEKDLLQMELTDEQQRQERIAREEEAALERRHYVEYTGITIGIAAVFLLLVLMGAFRVSEGTIKVMGFFAFILLFEFIILLADTKIHAWTHGEPLKVLGIKIILIAMLLPLHHWLEHRVVSYLASRRLMIPSRRTLFQSLRSKHKEEV